MKYTMCPKAIAELWANAVGEDVWAQEEVKDGRMSRARYTLIHAWCNVQRWLFGRWWWK